MGFIRLRSYIRLSITLILVSLSPLIWLFFCPIRLLTILISRASGKYGKLTSLYDGLLDEHFENHNPRSVIVTTLELNGDITAHEVCCLFKETVLNKTICEGRRRYPEFQQYLTTLLGYRIWKNDPHFQIENHIRETCQRNGEYILDMGKFHEKLINSSFEKNRSPWEIILVRNVIPVDGTTKSENCFEFPSTATKTVLAFRIHHAMADAKSILKVLVGCLGKKKLQIPEASPNPEKSFHDRILIWIGFPFRILSMMRTAIYLTYAHHLHPWKTSADDQSKVFVKFSERIFLEDVKEIAKRHNVQGSAVIIAMISGAIQRFDKNLANKKTASGYVLPKPNHPDVLTNHVYGTVIEIPTDENSMIRRLFKSNAIFKFIRKPEYGICGEFILYAIGTLPFLLTKFMAFNNLSTIGITNIAGEREDFSICDAVCTGFRMSVGCGQGCVGAVFLIISYKDSFRVAVTGKESVFNDDELQTLANQISTEVDAMKSIKL